MMKYFASLAGALLFIFVFTACSSSGSAIQSQSKTSGSGNQRQDSPNIQVNKNVNKQTLLSAINKSKSSEIPIKRVLYTSYYSIPPRPAGGVWYYTKDDHAGNLEGVAKWEREDMIFVQVPDREYYGYIARPVSLKKQGKEVVQITLKLEKGDWVATKLPPRTIISVAKGSIDPKSVKFRVTTESGENLMAH
ncbi:hypothetical protein [Lihuaxuella thermophila]|uniref:Lipoprotein n=1 Tax=Lihuaxuella thermophila TaxID=1173111 RepID=A0A1H8CVT8_9BACL|nr:hypothetical protein [Lihuaxuella thermophila]SEM98992.1 hypothetical protein SAMN05444955_104138 [Lihuaxuella thermophila]